MTARPGIEPSGGLAACSVSKAALAHLTRILDVELPPYKIRVSAVAPQLIDTPANRAFVPADIPAHAVSSEAIAAVIAFLISDAARRDPRRQRPGPGRAADYIDPDLLAVHHRRRPAPAPAAPVPAWPPAGTAG
jgi:NAD(P)-dependent dehydrogenase (short-subunit alcohol dehydrogenase family)